MAEHNELGKRGEELAREYLAGKGYKILSTNHRFGNYEVDIIAKHENFLAIVEVKTRCTAHFGEPEEFVSKQKQTFLIRAAASYVQQKNIPEEVRFDIISVLINGNNFRVHHIPDAFYPTVN